VTAGTLSRNENGRFGALKSDSSPEFIQNIITIKENSYNFRYQNTVDVPRPRTTRYDKESFTTGSLIA
jgi:hypothetical protein